MRPSYRKGIAVTEMLVLLLGALGAGGMYSGDAAGSNYSKVRKKVNIDAIDKEEGIDSVNKAVEDLRKSVSTKILVMSMWEKRGGENIIMAIQNIGQNEFNTTDLSLVPVNRRPGSGNCFTPSNSTKLGVEEIYYCNTGIKFPKVYKKVKFEIMLDGSSKKWYASCRPKTSDSAFC